MNQSIFTAEPRFEPWWWEAAPSVARDDRTLPAGADVAVVGAGFTGLSAALTLARAGRSVVVLDGGAPGQGASKRNGGMIGSGHRVGLAALTARYGRETAVALLREGHDALEFTAELIGREEIACGFARCGRFRGAWTPAHYDAMGRELDALAKVVELEASLVPRAEQGREVATEAYHGGCVYHRHGALHPGLFHQGLLERAETAGAVVIGGTPVRGLERTAPGFAVVTARGRLAARNVLVATNGYTGAATPQFRRRLVPVPSYIVATEDLGSERVARLIPGGRMIVETRARHCYYRASPDGTRILFGGRAALKPIDTRASAKILRRLMVGLFPDLATVEISHSWSGFVAMTRDQLPHVGVRDGVHYALGYSGSGVAMAPYLGHKAAQKLLGRAEGNSPFDATPFPAVPFLGAAAWFLPLIDLYFRLQDRRERSA